MATQLLNPLTGAHCMSLAEVLASIPSLRATYEAFERCGLDCQAELQAIAEQQNICMAIRAKFDPTEIAKVPQQIGEPRPLETLNSGNCKVIESVIQAWPALRATLEAHKACGVDCDHDFESLKAIYDTCSVLKRELMPNVA